MAMDRQVRGVFARSVILFVLGVVLASLFLWSMMQGILVHATRPSLEVLSGRDTAAFVYYFIGWISGVGALALYWQARNLYHYAEISK